jgi:hypothetical protein
MKWAVRVKGSISTYNRKLKNPLREERVLNTDEKIQNF